MFKHTVNLYKDADLLDEIIIEGLTRHQALLASDLENMTIVSESTIINEKVYRDEIFMNLYEKMMSSDRHMFTTKELSEYFPLNSKVHKKLKRHSSDLNKLYVSICDFDLDSLFFELKHWSNGKIANDLIIEKANEIRSTVKESSNGFFITFGKNRLFGIMFFNKNKLTLNTLKHEFIHYYNWMKGDVSDIYSADENLYEEEFDLMKRYFNMTSNEFRYVTKDKEYETLLNDFLDLLEKVRQIFFKNLSGHDFAYKICEDMFIERTSSTFESNEHYIKRMISLDYYDFFEGKSSFLMFIIYNLLDEKLWNIKNHIYGAFNDK